MLKNNDVTRTESTIVEALESVITNGDLSKLSSKDRISYYNQVCKSIGLNPLTKPLQYIWLKGTKEDNYTKRLTLYAAKDCTDQLRQIHGVSIRIISREFDDDLYTVVAQASDKTGRVDEATGVVCFTYKTGNGFMKAKGEMKANLLMKAETKAKRRVTLSICGLGWLDESETDSIPDAIKVDESVVDLIGESKEKLVFELNKLIDDFKIPQETVEKWLVYFKVSRLEEISEEALFKLINQTKKRYALAGMECKEAA